MGIFNRLFSGKTDPKLERHARSIESALAESEKAQGAQGLAKSAVEGAKRRHLLFQLLAEFEAATGRSGLSIVDTLEGDGRIFADRQLIELFRKHGDLPNLSSFFPTADVKRQMDEKWPTIVSTFQEKPNTQEILLEKADMLANYIILKLGIAIDICKDIIASSLPKDGREVSKQKEQLIKLEEAAVWFRAINDMANWTIRRECPLFMHYLEDAFGFHLAAQGALPEAVVNIVGPRVAEYASYQELYSENPKESVLWAAGKHLMEALGIGPHIWFQLFFDRLFLTHLNEALIAELLTGRKASKQ